MRITAKAPIRIDLAGGTLDLWPLYLLTPGAMTINLAINLEATATVRTIAGSRTVRLRSQDQGAELEFGWDALDAIEAPPALALPIGLLRHYRALAPAARLSEGLEIITEARSPAGAGLGGSSGLNISLTGALYAWAHGRAPDPLVEGADLVRISRDAETQVLHVPAGLQDYYGAMFGGLQAIRWGVGSHDRRWLDESLARELGDRLCLYYSGRSRNSGINNWVLFKNLIQRDPATHRRFAAIAAATRDLRDALAERDFHGAARAIAAEWSTRRELAEGISTPEMEQAFERARALGLDSYKVCGAGGGGCFFVFMPDADPTLRARLDASIGELGIQPLPFSPSLKGLRVTLDA